MGITRKIVGGVMAGGIAIFAGTASNEDKTTRDAAGAITESGGLGVFAMKVGDCVQLPHGDEAVAQSVEGVPCSQPHDGQVFDEFQLSAPVMPSLDEMGELSFNGCAERFFDATGLSEAEAQQLDLYYFSPTEESWMEIDDRTVTCIMVSLDGSPLTGDKMAAS